MGAEGKAVEYEHGTLEPSASSCLPHLLSSVLTQAQQILHPPTFVLCGLEDAHLPRWG